MEHADGGLALYLNATRAETESPPAEHKATNRGRGRPAPLLIGTVADPKIAIILRLRQPLGTSFPRLHPASAGHRPPRILMFLEECT